MKTIAKIMLLPIGLWAACTNKQKATKDFVPGTYVNHAQSSYSVADDTLQIKADALTENGYYVTRKTVFRRLKDGKFQPPEHQTKILNGVWDAQKLTLQLTQNGTLLLFRPGSNQLVIESSTYQKIK